MNLSINDTRQLDIYGENYEIGHHTVHKINGACGPKWKHKRRLLEDNVEEHLY